MPRTRSLRKSGSIAAAASVAMLAGCSPTQISFGSRTLMLPFGGGGTQQAESSPQLQTASSMPPAAPAMGSGVTQSSLPALPQSSGESIGSGPVRVALLLPLSGEAGLSMVNGARLAMAYIESNPNIAENTTIVLKDTGGSTAGATAAANAAVSEGARLIMGPLQADQVAAAGAVARSAGIPLIGFANTPAAAGPGVYLLNVLPESEVRRSLAFAQRQGRTRFAAIVPTTPVGQAQEAAFRGGLQQMGLMPAAVHQFATTVDAETIVANLAPLLTSGRVDAIFLPDRSSAPLFAGLLADAGVSRQSVAVIGSAEWEGDPAIAASPFLASALYPAVDDAGYRAILPEYQARFGGTPHRLTTLAYTATILANAAPLSRATPPYNAPALTNPQGFNGRDGLFRFGADGRAQMALAMKEVRAGGAVTVDGARL